MSIQDQIRALQPALNPDPQFRFERVENYAYERGHKECCNAAANIAAPLEASHAELLAALRAVLLQYGNVRAAESYPEGDSPSMQAARAAIANADKLNNAKQ